jgi:hypothetical protein
MNALDAMLITVRRLYSTLLYSTLHELLDAQVRSALTLSVSNIVFLLTLVYNIENNGVCGL